MRPGPHPFRRFTEADLAAASATTALLFEAAQRLDLSLLGEPEFGYVGRVEGRGRVLNYFGALLDINPAAASALTRDKGYCAGILADRNIPQPRTCTFFAPDFAPFGRTRGTAAALRFAQELGFPVFVKPNEGSRAVGALRADDEDQLAWALARSFARPEGRVSVVQEYASGPELRLIVLDGGIRLAYRKVAMALQGDGMKTIAELMAGLGAARRAAGRKAPALDDSRILDSLARRGLSLDSRPLGPCALGDGLTLELSAEVEVIPDPPPAWRGIARAALEALGLRFGSLDTILRPDGELTVLEVNSAPGLTAFAQFGHREEAIAIYAEVFRSFFGPCSAG